MNKHFGEWVFIKGLIMKIVNYPDKILLTPCEPLKEFNGAFYLHEFIEDMKKTMVEASGLGLAAPQVGFSLQVFVMKLKNGEIKEFINPKFTAHCHDVKIGDEGCLSFPNIMLQVERSTECYVSYQDITGERREAVLEGLEAIIFQHEYDHLQGNTFLKRVSRQQRRAVERQFK